MMPLAALAPVAHSNAAWLPDVITEWYDLLEPHLRDPLIKKVRYEDAAVHEWRRKLVRNPATVNEIIRWINEGTQREAYKRIYWAVRAASEAFEAVQVDRPNAALPWLGIRRFWEETGRLNKVSPGVLLPARNLGHLPWHLPRDPKPDEPLGHFGGFIRVCDFRPPMDQVMTIETAAVPWGSAPLRASGAIRVAVVPLVESCDEFQLEERKNGGFRIGLRDPAAILNRARNALRQVSENEVDVVLYPELTFGSQEQESFGEDVRRAASGSGGFPWLVVAGSAPVLDKADAQVVRNTARAFDRYGRKILEYSKLHQYTMATREIDRYGLAEALDYIGHDEDIATIPRKVALIETPAGRVGVVICEDLARYAFVTAVLATLQLDWLLVPVLDGAQTEWRWAGRRARQYAESFRVIGVVGTSYSLVRSHVLAATKSGDTLPENVGLIAIPGTKTVSVEMLPWSGNGDAPVVYEVATKPD